MNDLEPEGTPTNLTEASYPLATRQPVLLCCRELEEAQGQKARSIGDPAQELTPATVGDLRELDLTFHRGSHTWKERADLPYPRTIFIAQGQNEQKILNLRDAQALQLFRESLTHTT
jgi:hypothetical protein